MMYTEPKLSFLKRIWCQVYYGTAIQQQQSVPESTFYIKRYGFHREGAPAILHNDKSYHWYKWDMKHREGGPASEIINYRSEYFLYGQRHNGKGAAIAYVDELSADEYWLHDKKLSYADWLERSDHTEKEKTIMRLTVVS